MLRRFLSLFQVGNLGLLFMLLFFIYAALGVELFGELGEFTRHPAALLRNSCDTFAKLLATSKIADRLHWRHLKLLVVTDFWRQFIVVFDKEVGSFCLVL